MYVLLSGFTVPLKTALTCPMGNVCNPVSILWRRLSRSLVPVDVVAFSKPLPSIPLATLPREYLAEEMILWGHCGVYRGPYVLRLVWECRSNIKKDAFAPSQMQASYHRG